MISPCVLISPFRLTYWPFVLKLFVIWGFPSSICLSAVSASLPGRPHIHRCVHKETRFLMLGHRCGVDFQVMLFPVSYPGQWRDKALVHFILLVTFDLCRYCPLIQPIPPHSPLALSEINSVWFYWSCSTEHIPFKVINTTIKQLNCVICDIPNRKWILKLPCTLHWRRRHLASSSLLRERKKTFVSSGLCSWGTTLHQKQVLFLV